MSLRQGAWGVRPSWRRGYVERQLSIARQALCLGSAAAARAALRVLSGEDFVSAGEAATHLQTLRDRTVGDEIVITALHRLCLLEPVGESPPLAGTG